MKHFRMLGQLFSRAGFSGSLNKTFGGLRDLGKTLGYRTDTDVDTFLSFYERGDIAARIIDIHADTSWQYDPEIQLEDAEAEGQTFIDEVKALDDRVALWSKMAQVDRVSGIGRFGILLIGMRGDGEVTELSEPATPLSGGMKDVMFLKAFHEGQVVVASWEEDQFHERFGLPLIYNVTFTRGDDAGETVKPVHWSRVIHVAEKLLDDETYGIPKLQQIVNKLDDLNKLIGSAAEIFWIAVAGLIHADLDPDVDVNEDDMEKFEKDLVEAMQGIRRVVQTRGVELTRIASNGNVDPSATYDAIKELISATEKVPNRVLFGSERGELASSQDQRTWHAIIKQRQSSYVEPRIVRTFFKRLEMLGVKQPIGWKLFWPPLDEPTELELAEIAELKGKAAVAMAPGGQADILIKPWEAREILGLSPVPEEPPEGAEKAFAEPDPTIPE